MDKEFCFHVYPHQLTVEAMDTEGHTNHVQPHTCRLKEAAGFSDPRCVASRFIPEHPVGEHGDYEGYLARLCPDFAIDEEFARERAYKLTKAYDKILGKS